MINKFIIHYFKNLKFFILVILISLIATFYTAKTLNKYRIYVFNIESLPILQLNQLAPSSTLLNILAPGKTIVSPQGVIDQKIKSSLEIISNAIFENVIDLVSDYEYKKKFLKDNPEIINYSIKTNNLDYAKFTFKTKLDVKKSIDVNFFYNFIKVSNENTKDLIGKLLKDKSSKDYMVNLENMNKFYKIKDYSENLDRPIHSAYIFLIFFIIFNYLYFLFFYFTYSKIKLKV